MELLTARESTPEPLSPVPAESYELRGPGLFVTVEAPAIADVLPTLHIEDTYYLEWAGHGSSAAEPPIFFTDDGLPERIESFPGEGDNGWFLTVMDEAITDARTVTLALLIPRVNVTGAGDVIDIDTVAIIMTHRANIAGPALVNGLGQRYQIVPLSGSVRQTGP